MSLFGRREREELRTKLAAAETELRELRDLRWSVAWREDCIAKYRADCIGLRRLSDFWRDLYVDDVCPDGETMRNLDAEALRKAHA